MSTECRECRAGLAHCHGTVIHHVRMRAECTEAVCMIPLSEHAFQLDCESIDCRCAGVLAQAL